ncbi:unnamed protein product [Penicillium olsonii]|uniref:Hemerythrin-like domain-containing protein n=1 Tax=Penicillium olsonii TaxID=99116 RepID=A0A9W4MWK2_PENOL|nr:unnamed protein product [Penicillium olsonii]CAG8166236.1 unnamed protein product [Penicillium olsonii]
MVRISEAITDDHRKLESLYETIVNSEDADEQTRFQNQFTWELARHAVAEELVVHPAIEKVLPDGSETTDRDRREHSTIKEMLNVFQDLNCSDARFLPTITVLMEGLTQHMRDETIELANLDSYLGLEESEQLAESLESTKMFVPSMSHPEIPNTPYETVTGLLAAPLDHLQDMFKKWPEKESPME